MRRRWWIGAGSAALLFLFSSRVYQVNMAYPDAVEEKAGIEEAIEYDGVEYTVKDARFYTMGQQEQESFPEDTIFMDGSGMIKLDLEVRNISGEKKTVESAYRRLETEGWSGGVDMNLYLYFNPDAPEMVWELEPGEVRTCILAYPIIPLAFSEKEWREVENREYCYVLSLYPIKKMIRILG